MLRGFRFVLKPTPAQAETLGQWAGVNRLVYNLAFEQRRDFWRQFRAARGRTISLATQGPELTALRREFDFIAAVPQTILEAGLVDLDRAFDAFFSKRASYPKPRRLGLNDTMRFRGRDVRIRPLNAKWAMAKLPKIGEVKFRLTRTLLGAIKTVTLVRRANAWSVAFACEVGAAASCNDRPAVGIDRGVANTLSLSNGETVRLRDLSLADRKVRRAQRVLARRKRGSRRYAAQRARVASLRSCVARMRTDDCHRMTTAIARRFGVVALEDLDIAAMTSSARGTVEAPGRNVKQKAGLNRSILNQAWGRIGAMLEYKLEAEGGRLVYVPAAYTSQTCSGCGVVDARSRKSQAVFACVHCGHEAHADTNAALEIRRRSTALLLVEGGQLGRPVEARTLAA